MKKPVYNPFRVATRATEHAPAGAIVHEGSALGRALLAAGALGAPVERAVAATALYLGAGKRVEKTRPDGLGGTETYTVVEPLEIPKGATVVLAELGEFAVDVLPSLTSAVAAPAAAPAAPASPVSAEGAAGQQEAPAKPVRKAGEPAGR